MGDWLNATYMQNIKVKQQTSILMFSPLRMSSKTLRIYFREQENHKPKKTSRLLSKLDKNRAGSKEE